MRREFQVLEDVSLAPKDLRAYVSVVGSDVVDRILELAKPLIGARVLHVNATAYGGGVAELLATHVALLRSAGLDAHWQVISGTDQFFEVTKAVHNGLQGADVGWNAAMEATYLEVAAENAAALEGSWDFVVIHDPQPAAMLALIEDQAVGPRASGRASGREAIGKNWIWRCHIDLTTANEKVWGFYRPFVERHDASVWTMAEFVPNDFSMDRITIAPPCIDPLSEKNVALPDEQVAAICAQFGIDVARPIICQVSRFDPWKDPVGVIEAFRIVRAAVPGCQLILAGSMASDDPEGGHYWDLTSKAADGDPDIHLLSNLDGVGAIEINAFQQACDVVLQKSLREGFGLTVSEAMWKGKPVVGGDCGGIRLQIKNAENGFLVDSVDECAARTLELLGDATRRDAFGISGREHVRANFLSTREVHDWLTLFNTIATG